MRINNNLMSMNTYRQYSINSANAASSTEKLSSGFRINRAGDDAAGLAISEKMRAQIRGLNMASKNSQDAISLVQTAEGALNETHSILQRMRELATQSASDTNDSETVDRDALNKEFQALKSEINDIAQKTAFNGKSLLDGSLGAVTKRTGGTLAPGADGITKITASGLKDTSVGHTGTVYTLNFAAESAGNPYQATLDGKTISVTQPADAEGALTLDFGDGVSVTIDMASHAANAFGGESIQFTVTGGEAIIQTGANTGDELSIGINDMGSAALELNNYSTEVDAETSVGTGTVQLLTQKEASAAIKSVNNAINTVSTERSKLGAFQNRLQHKINNLDTSAENLTAAESRIRDLDMAKEMTNYTKNNILVQAATAMLAQANSAPQGVLQLLQ